MFCIFDLDGTLANIEHRRHHLDRKDWDAFFAACVDDLPNEPVIAALQAHLNALHRVEIWSARSEVVRHETVAWLHRVGIPGGLLVNMRARGDYTPDVALKRSWLHAIHPDERPDIVYDDRQGVVDMWREEGIACFQVAANWEADERTIAPLRDPLLTIMVGPSGGGKTEWLNAEQRRNPTVVFSSDRLREWYTGSEGDQSRNADVFTAIHKLAKATMECGLPVTIDATNIRRKDRLACVALAPAGAGVRYVVCNRPMAEKHATAGRRAGVVMADGKCLIDAHEQRFQSQLKDLLRGDGLPQVTVVDMRDAQARAVGLNIDGSVRRETVQVAA